MGGHSESSTRMPRRLLDAVWLTLVILTVIVAPVPWLAYVVYRGLGFSHVEMAAGSSYSSLSGWAILCVLCVMPVLAFVLFGLAFTRRLYQVALRFLALALAQVAIGIVMAIVNVVLVG